MSHARNPKSRQDSGFSAPKESEKLQNTWPPFCCAAAFVVAALEKLGHSNIERESLARRLEIAVAPASRNPWGLKVEVDPNSQGLTVAAATDRIPRVLKAYNPELSFRHLYLSQITLGLVEDVLVQADRQGCVVGIGYDFNRLGAQSTAERRHVARIEPAADSEHVVILDDSVSRSPLRQMVRWFELLPAVNAINDGYWLIGTRAQMSLDYAP
jgi:hypothetical protein